MYVYLFGLTKNVLLAIHKKNQWSHMSAIVLRLETTQQSLYRKIGFSMQKASLQIRLVIFLRTL